MFDDQDGDDDDEYEDDDDEDFSDVDGRMLSMIDEFGTEGVMQNLRAYVQRAFPQLDVAGVDKWLHLQPDKYGATIELPE